MLFRKMLRDFRKNFGAFFSVFLLSALAMTLFCTREEERDHYGSGRRTSL